MSLLWHRVGEALLLPAPHLPGVRTVSSSPVWTDVGSLLNRAGGDGQGRAEEPLTGPTRKVPVTMGAVRGSAVWKAMLEAAGDLRGCLEGPSWGGSALGAEYISLLAVGGNSCLLLSPGQSWFDQQLLCAGQPGPCPQPSPVPEPLELPELETRDGPNKPLRQDRPDVGCWPWALPLPTASHRALKETQALPKKEWLHPHRTGARV